MASRVNAEAVVRAAYERSASTVGLARASRYLLDEEPRPRAEERGITTGRFERYDDYAPAAPMVLLRDDDDVVVRPRAEAAPRRAVPAFIPVLVREAGTMQRVHDAWSTAPATPFRRSRAASLAASRRAARNARQPARAVAPDAAATSPRRAASPERAAQFRSDPLMMLLFMALGMCLSCLAWLVVESPTTSTPEADAQPARPMYCAH